MSNFLLTRRSALIGGFSSLLIPSAAASIIKNAAPIDPWDQVAVHAFALQDALHALPEPHWFLHKIGHGYGDTLGAFNPTWGSPGGGYHALTRPALEWAE